MAYLAHQDSLERRKAGKDPWIKRDLAHFSREITKLPICQRRTAGKKVKKYISHIIGLFWCVAVFYGIYFYYTLVMGLDFNDLPHYFAWISDYILYAVGVVGLVFYFVYDRFIYVVRTIIYRYLGKIIK